MHGDYRDNCWTSEESTICVLVDQLHDHSRIDNALFNKLAIKFGEDQIIELTMVIGNSHQVSFLVNVATIDNDHFAPTFPSRDSDQ